MIVVKLAGGLGNQMFQYAFARTLALRHNTQLFIDNSTYSHPEDFDHSLINTRLYELDIFNIQGQIVDDKNEKKLIKIRKERKLRKAMYLCFCRIANMFSDSVMPLIYERKDIRFDKSLLKLPDNMYLRGYFPSYMYFDSNKDIIRKDFSFNKEPNEMNHKMIENIISVNSVSIHVRRGDYITNQKTNSKFGPCSLNYYRRSIKYIFEHAEKPHFFVFSNDTQWVNDNIKIDHPVTYVTHNTGNKNYEDMRLMSHCKHNIIANSSFSWWGAWLNRNPDKIVVAPTPAFDKLEIKDDDFYPKHWVKLPKY